MDAVDFAIFRYMSPHGRAQFWGSRRRIDPRITPKDISGLVGISESGVRRRIARAASDGYYRGTQVCINPSVFGVQEQVVEVSVEDSGQSQRLLNDLALVDGVTFARDILDESHRKLRIHFVTDGPATTARRLALLRRFAPPGSVQRSEPYWIPPCDHALGNLEFRVLRAVRVAPDEPLSEIAKSVHLSLKSASRYFHRLLDSLACWWTHSQSSDEFPLSLLIVRLESGGDRTAVARQIDELTGQWMPVADDGFGSSAPGSQPFLAGLTPIISPARLERLIDQLSALSRVTLVTRTFALGSRTYPDWCDRHLEEACARH